jgi:hypothetical protein
MHQQVDEDDGARQEKKEISERQRLLNRKHQAMGAYRSAVRWACIALDYKRKYEREEDFGTDALADSIKILKEDSRNEVRRISTDIKLIRIKINNIDKRLMDLSEKENESD